MILNFFHAGCRIRILNTGKSNEMNKSLFTLDPDPTIFVINLQDADKKLIFLKSFLRINF
jgi:hypothetical protein